jgi:putative flippase GtrA
MISKQFIKFICVGAACTIINYFSFLLLLNLFYINFLLSSALGYLVGLLFGYFFNRVWTFQADEDSLMQKIKYFLTYIFSLIIGLLVLNALVKNLDIESEIANIYVILITTILNFLGTKVWVFKK